MDHVVNHGLTMREAGQRDQLKLSRYTVASIIRTFRLENRTARRPPEGGRQCLFTREQEVAIVNLVLADHSLRLHQLRERIIADGTTFGNIDRVSTSTLSRILRQHQPMKKKQLDRVPFERNSVAVKELRYDYVQRVLEIDAAAQPHSFIFIDEAGFSLAKTRRRGRHVIGQRAVVDSPGQRGGNITMCAAISLEGVLHRHATLGPYNTAHIVAFLDGLRNAVVQDGPEETRFVVIWDNVRFHRAALVRDWFASHHDFTDVYLPPYSPFLNPIEEFFSAWRWKVYDRQPHAHMPLLQAMDEACGDVEEGSVQGWIRHARGYFPRCLDKEDIACDVDEEMWPDPEKRRDP